MTNIESPVTRPMSTPSLPSTTIYRDTPLSSPQPRLTPRFARPFRSSVRALDQSNELVSDGILLGLAAMLLPTVAYSLAHVLGPIASGSLERAIHAFLP